MTMQQNSKLPIVQRLRQFNVSGVSCLSGDAADAISKMFEALQMVRELDDAYGIDFTEQQRDQLHDAMATVLPNRICTKGDSAKDFLQNLSR